MKKLFTLIVLVLVIGHQVMAQCNPYFNMKEGASWEMTSYSAKGKAQGKSRNEVISFDETSNGYESVLKVTVFDKSDKKAFESELGISCADQVMQFDMKQFMAPGSLESMQSMEMEITGDNLEYPPSLSVGDVLKPGKMNIEAGSANIPMKINISIEIVDRKVEAFESVTTPAGTFECYKISSTVKTKTIMSFEAKTIEWVAEGQGVIKTESYSKKGKLTGYSLLTKN